MLEWARHGARELDWIIADRQTAGRGRHGRDWISPSGNLYATTLVKLRDGDPPAHTLSLVAAIAAHHAVKAVIDCFGRVDGFERARIKWPNDIMIDRAKVAGLLLERDKNAVAVGFGINLVSSPQDIGRPTTYVFQHSDLVVTPDDMRGWLDGYFRTFFQRWRSREQGGLAWVRTAWLSCAHPIGTAISMRVSEDQKIEGLFDGLDENGALRLRLADGSVRVIQAGDVFLL